MKSKADERILVILDLDETLIYATQEPNDSSWDFEVGPYKVFKRPYLDQFLEELSKHFKVAVWSSASEDYVAEIVKNIFPPNYPLEFVWARPQCTRQLDYEAMEADGYVDYHSHAVYVKILKKVKKKGYAPIEKMLIIDDTPRKAKYNYGNAIYPEEFKGNPQDNELALLIKYLMTLKEVENVRTISKRGWKSYLA